MGGCKCLESGGEGRELGGEGLEGWLGGGGVCGCRSGFGGRAWEFVDGHFFSYLGKLGFERSFSRGEGVVFSA